MSKGGGTQTTTNTTAVDPETQRFIREFRGRAGSTFDQFSGGALNPQQQQFSNLAGNAAATGLGIAGQQGLTGIEGFFNPFESQVIGGLQSDFDRQRAQAGQTAADAATRAGAFGGSRSAVLDAQLRGDISRNESGTLANFRNLGFQNAAGQLLGERGRFQQLGLAGLQGLGNLGNFLDQRQLAALGQLQGGFQPGSTTTTTEEELQGGGLLSGIGGLAGTIGGGLLAGPIGASIGGSLGSSLGGKRKKAGGI